MKYTKSDLCANRAKLDLTALQNVAESALFLLRDEILRQAEKSHAFPRIDINSIAQAASRVAELAPKYAEAAEMLHVMNEASNRDEIIIVNRPAYRNTF